MAAFDVVRDGTTADSCACSSGGVGRLARSLGSVIGASGRHCGLPGAVSGWRWDSIAIGSPIRGDSGSPRSQSVWRLAAPSANRTHSVVGRTGRCADRLGSISRACATCHAPKVVFDPAPSRGLFRGALGLQISLVRPGFVVLADRLL